MFIIIFRRITHSFESIQSRYVQKGDSSKVQDQTVDINCRNADVGRKLGVPVDASRKVFEVNWLVQVLHVAFIFGFSDGSI